jgi:serine phosphatase RsbU (regulator of sigma subunit)
MSSDIHSPAFRRAALASEKLRVLGLLVILTVVLAFTAVRAPWLGVEHVELQRQFLALLVAYIAYEAFRLAVVFRCIRAGRDLPLWSWAFNLLLESALPTLGLLLLTRSPSMGPYRALAAPMVSAYFLFILLSILRLSPLASLMSGLLAAAGYFAAVTYTYATYPNEAARAGVFPFPIYATYGVLLILGGGAAGAVAQRIRIHVLAALREEDLRRELELARSIQMGLLPTTAPVLPGYEIAGWNQPADETGGDYYDWQTLEDGRVVVTLADVTGHGISSALVAAVCRAYARSLLPLEAGLEPLVGRLNALLASDLPANRFVTMVMAVLEPGASRLHLLSAGHGPILVYRRSENEFQDLPAQGIPLGISDGFPFGAPQEITLAPGDMAILLTDGFIEWEDPAGEQFGLARLQDAIRSHADLPAQALIAELYSQLLRFTRGTKQSDDLTAVVIKRT